MTIRTLPLALLFALALPAVHAQSKEPEKHETPPDVTAFGDANKITDPAAKIAAFEKFKKDFPDSNMVVSANLSILSTLAAKMPDQTARIEEFAKTMVGGAKDKRRRRRCPVKLPTRCLRTRSC